MYKDFNGITFSYSLSVYNYQVVESTIKYTTITVYDGEHSLIFRGESIDSNYCRVFELSYSNQRPKEPESYVLVESIFDFIPSEWKYYKIVYQFNLDLIMVLHLVKKIFGDRFTDATKAD